MRRITLSVFSFLLLFCSQAQVEVIVNDVGAGHSSIIKLPDGKFGLYDAGGTHIIDKGVAAFEKIQATIPQDRPIEFMIISHSDADHLYAANDVLDRYKVKKFIHTGFVKKDSTKAYRSMIRSLKKSVREKGTEVINLARRGSRITSADNFSIGEVDFEFLSGFDQPPRSWGLREQPKKLNAVSIVMRMNYQGGSVLFTGDAVGRKLRDRFNTLIATDKFLIETAKDRLDVDVVIAPHHGADNGSSMAFCDATKPDWVIFPAGSTSSHPIKQTVERYIEFGGTSRHHMFRTDRGEGFIEDPRAFQRYLNASHRQLKEWAGQSKRGCSDTIGDDDVVIAISRSGIVDVNYKNPDPCH